MSATPIPASRSEASMPSWSRAPVSSALGSCCRRPTDTEPW